MNNGLKKQQFRVAKGRTANPLVKQAVFQDEQCFVVQECDATMPNRNPTAGLKKKTTKDIRQHLTAM